MFRRIFFVLLLWFYTVVFSRKAMRCDPATSTSKEMDYWGIKWGEKAVQLSGIEIEADMGDVDPEGHYVFIVNHQSNLDIPVLYQVLENNNVRYVAKKSLFEIPIYGPALRHAGHICIDRENRRSAMKSLNEAVEKAKSGISPVIFPEGTRNQNLEELMEFKVGGMIIALKSGLPVVPIVMTNTGKIMGKGAKMITKGPVVRVKALPIIDPSEYTLKDREKLKDDLYEMMNKAYKELLAEG